MPQGQFQQTDFFDNTGGTNLSDSVFRIKDNQAAGGYNFDYLTTGGIKKRNGPVKLNSSANAQLRSLGLGLYAPASGSSKTIIRAGGTKIQTFNPSSQAFTNLTADFVFHKSDFWTAGTTETVQVSQFNNGVSNILWMAGGGATLGSLTDDTPRHGIWGVTGTSGNVVTQNGTATLEERDEAASAVLGPNGAGTWAATGTYSYAFVYRKTSTQAFSNASRDSSVTISATTNTINVGGGFGETDMDAVYIYRSAVNAGPDFTVGDLVHIDTTGTTFNDTGSSIAESQNVPRAGNTILDNSRLPDGTYNVVTTFKRRLVTAVDSTLYLSDVNKSESWPTTNVITVPSIGNITALAVISFTSAQAQTLDELLVIFKEREIWVITGTDFTDWALKFIDQVGCPDQGLIVVANGFLAWIDYRGIYLWDGGSKPIYSSRLLEPLFARDGDIDKTKITLGTAEFFRRENQIIWYLSSRTYGEQRLAIKMDLRLTLPQIDQAAAGRNIDAVLIQDVYAFPIYAAMSFIPLNAQQEELLLGDASGYLYYAENITSDATASYSFTYKTKYMNFGDPSSNKLFHKVIVWVNDLGTWNLTLDYWSDYRTGTIYQCTKGQPISTEPQQQVALWDVAYWDVAYWDSYQNNVIPLVFNLDPGEMNSNQGKSLQLQFRQETADQPVTIHGFSVVWSELGGIT